MRCVPGALPKLSFLLIPFAFLLSTMVRGGVLTTAARTILDLQVPFGMAELRKAYKVKSLQTRPDNPGGSNDAFDRVSKAFEHLRNLVPAPPPLPPQDWPTSDEPAPPPPPHHAWATSEEPAPPPPPPSSAATARQQAPPPPPPQDWATSDGPAPPQHPPRAWATSGEPSPPPQPPPPPAAATGAQTSPEAEATNMLAKLLGHIRQNHMVILAGSEKEFFDVLVTAVNAQCGWLAKKTIKRALWCEPLSSESAQLYKQLSASRGPVDTVLEEPRHEPQQQPQQDNVAERVTEESEVERVMEENVGQQAQDNLQLSHRTGRARVVCLHCDAWRSAAGLGGHLEASKCSPELVAEVLHFADMQAADEEGAWRWLQNKRDLPTYVIAAAVAESWAAFRVLPFCAVRLASVT